MWPSPRLSHRLSRLSQSAHAQSPGLGDTAAGAACCTRPSAYLDTNGTSSHVADAASARPVSRTAITASATAVTSMGSSADAGDGWGRRTAAAPSGGSPAASARVKTTMACSGTTSHAGPSALKPPSTPMASLVGAAAAAAAPSLGGARATRRARVCRYTAAPVRARSSATNAAPTDACVARFVYSPPGDSGVSKEKAHSDLCTRSWPPGTRSVGSTDRTAVVTAASIGRRGSSEGEVDAPPSASPPLTIDIDIVRAP